MSKKIHFTLSEAALEVINRRADSPNKRGEWISSAVVDYDAILSGSRAGDELGVIEQIESRMGRLEQMAAAILLEVGRKP